MKIFRGAMYATAVAGSLLAYNAQAVNLSADGVGEVATAPYYTVRDGWSTLINLTNTQSYPILVKVRVHESLNSRDVLDFTVGMSANDVFTAVLKESDAGKAVLQVRDSVVVKTDSNGAPVLDADGNEQYLATCTVPKRIAEGTVNGDTRTLIGQEIPLSSVATVGDSVADTRKDDRLKEGYIEFIVMGYADNNETYDKTAVTPVALGDVMDVEFKSRATAFSGFAGAARDAYINVFDAIEDHDCGALETALDETMNPNTGDIRILETAQQLGEPINALKFNFRLLHPARGIESGLAATTWANFFNPGTDALDGDVSPADNFDFARGGAGSIASCAAYRGRERLTSNDYGDNPSTKFTKEGGKQARMDFDWVPGISALTAIDQSLTSCQNLVAPQRTFGFLDPTFNDAYPPVAKVLDDRTNQLLTLAPNLMTKVPAAISAGTLDDGRVDSTGYSDSALAGGLLRGIDAVSATIMTASLVNEWVAKVSPNGGGTTTDWVVTQPTKSFYVDRDLFGAGATANSEAATRYSTKEVTERTENDIYAAITADNANETNLNTTFPFAPYVKAFQDNGVGVGNSCVTVTYQIYNRAEEKPTVVDPVDEPAGVIESPQPPVADEQSQTFDEPLCYEANVITFNEKSALVAAGPLNRYDVQTNLDLLANQPDPDFNAENGWMRLFLNQKQADGTVPKLNVGSTTALKTSLGVAATSSANVDLEGLPVIGFMLKVRTMEGVTTSGPVGNYASTVQHAVSRVISDPSAVITK